ncbi:MAG TPA: hypothetical protein VFA47_05115, partial [Candidatus Manganitrophaceae bacterium]|nr:hypothetical protein [Candidatus Manganitrophaceae bacterium]
MMAAGGTAAPRGENRYSDGASLPKGKISRAAGPLAGNQWINLGPAPILGYFQPSSGRVADIAADPADPGHWLIGAAGGGVWETRDGGAGWIAKTDNQAAAAIGSVAFAPSDPRFLYAGTGEAFTQDAYNGQGLLKSSDGGATWQLLGADSFSELAFRGIQIHPADPNILLAATALPQRETRLPVKSPGIFKSTDGGATWTRKLDGNSTDLQRDPGRFDHLYTALWNTGAAGTGLYRSMDGGESWALIDGPWSAAGSGVGRIALAVAPSDPNILYVSVHDVRTDGLLGIWRSDRAWDPSPPFAKVPLSFREYQMHRNHKIIVDPSNPSVLYLGGTQLWKFDGTRWSNVRKEIHVDQQSMAWAGDRLIVGNDGGVFSTADGGNSWQSHNTNLSITQFYKGALHPTNPNFLLAGSEDNGVGEWTGTNSWRDILRGDGADAAISSLHPDTDWAAASFNLQISRTKDGGATFSRADGGIDKSGVPFIAHFEKCPSNDDLFIAGTVRLWKTDGFFSSPAPSWSPDSPPLPAGDEIRAMAFAPADPSCHTYAFGTKQGALRLTADGGKSWADLDAGNAVPDRAVSALSFHPSDSNILYVALSGFDE